MLHIHFAKVHICVYIHCLVHFFKKERKIGIYITNLSLIKIVWVFYMHVKVHVVHVALCVRYGVIWGVVIQLMCICVAYLEERLFEKRSWFCGGGGGGGGGGYLTTYPGKGISIL